MAKAINSKLVASSGKRVTSGKHRETELGAKRGKKCSWWEAREKVQQWASAGKRTSSEKHKKTYNWWQARKNEQTVASAGK